METKVVPTQDAGSLDSESPIYFSWKRHIDYSLQNTRILFLSPLGGALGIVFTLLIHLPMLIIACVAIMSIPLPVWLPARTKILARAADVAAYRQLLYRNYPLWMSFVFLLLDVSTTCQMLETGFDLRLIVGLPISAILVPLCCYVAHKFRGPLVMGPHILTMGDGKQFPYTDTRFDIVEPDVGVPGINLTRISDSQVTAHLAPVPYNFDFDTLLSTLEQLQVMSADGQPASPDAIKAMLTVDPPSKCGRRRLDPATARHT